MNELPQFTLAFWVITFAPRLGSSALGDYLADDSGLDFGTIGSWRVLAGILVAMIAGRRI